MRLMAGCIFLSIYSVGYGSVVRGQEGGSREADFTVQTGPGEGELRGGVGVWPECWRMKRSDFKLSKRAREK